MNFGEGFVIRLPGGEYVTAILSNGHPENPIVYKSRDIDEAKAWIQPSAVRKARAKIGQGGRILMVRKDHGKRVIVGQLGKDGEEACARTL